MNKVHCFLVWQVTWLFVLCSAIGIKVSKPKAMEQPVAPMVQAQPLILPMTLPPMPPPAPPQPVDPELIGVQVPIPKEMRVFNKSGSQCVWCTIEMLCKLHGVTAGQDLTKTFKHATGPGEVHRVLTQRGIKFRQVNGRDENFIEEYVTRKKLGVGIGINNCHVTLVVHFDKQAGVVKVIDNCDRELRIQTWTMQKFRSRFTGWVFVIFPDNAPESQFGSAGPSPGQEAEWRDWWDSKQYR